MEIKINDVYKFWYNAQWRKKILGSNWCFDGQLIVKENDKGKLFLVDTYWGDSCENKSFTLEQALEHGKLTFVCNLNDIEEIRTSEMNYYDDEDLFDPSRQHGCYKEFYKRKGAKKSANKMERVLKEKIEDIEREIKSKERDLEWTKGKLEELKMGISIFISKN